jgi:hypothetical protein
MKSIDNNFLAEIYQDILFKESFDKSMGSNNPLDATKLVNYINRIVTKKRTGEIDPKDKRSDYLKMPHIHPSIASKVLIKTTDGEEVDIDLFRQIVTKRPNSLLRQNGKMKKSATDDTVFYNTTLPALKGLVVDENTGEFRIVDTCPSAGNCKIKCYAKHNSFVMYPHASMFQHKTLNYLFNEPENFKNQIIEEIKNASLKSERVNKKVQIRWNDSGDLLSPKFFDIVMDIVKNTPMADHYIYTKEVEMVKSMIKVPENVIFNFSYGALLKQEKLIDPVKDKVSYIVDIFNQQREPILYPISHYGYIKRNDLRKWVYGDVNSTKSLIAQRYKINPTSLLTMDELKKTPNGKNGEYNVIVLPGESDLAASRRDVRGTYLIIH